MLGLGLANFKTLISRKRQTAAAKFLRHFDPKARPRKVAYDFLPEKDILP